MSEEFDRKAAVLAELASLEPGDVADKAGVRLTSREGWEDMLDTLAQSVRGVYENGEVDPRSPQSAAHKVADEMAGLPNLRTLIDWFAMLDDVLGLTVADPEMGSDESTFTAAPGSAMRDVLRGAVYTVLDTAAAQLIGYLEEVADQDEEKWNEEHPDDEDDDEGTE